VTAEIIAESYAYHDRPGVWWMCSRMNPIALALRRMGHDLSISYDTVLQSRLSHEHGFAVATPVLRLPEAARGFLRAFGLSLEGKESRRSLASRRALRKTSSDCLVPVQPAGVYKPVEPFEFWLELP